jgi:hypothetical protein
MQKNHPLATALFIIPRTNAGANRATDATKRRMGLFILTMACATLAGNSHAEVPIRTIAELEPIAPAIARFKPDFEAGGFRVDMPDGKIRQQAVANGYTNTLRFTGKSAASIDDNSLATDEYDTRLDFSKISQEKSQKETIVLELLPGQGGLSSVRQHVEFRYREGQGHRTREEVEAEMIAKYGKPQVSAVKAAESGTKSSNAHVMGFYCYDAKGSALATPDECDSEKAHADGYSYDIEVDERGDVVSYDVEYDDSSYQQSYMDALFAKMHSLIRSDQKPWWRLWL